MQKREAGQPRHEDLLGLSYAYPLPGGDSLIVEYYTDNLQASRQSNTVISVVNNILIEEEARATEVYEELQNYFQHRYGPSHGHYGEDHWTGELPAGRMEIRLILNPPGQGLTLNFLDLNING